MTTGNKKVLDCVQTYFVISLDHSEIFV